MNVQSNSPATGPMSKPSTDDAQIAIGAAMASCEADGHKCSCKQFGWQFSPYDPQQCNARLGAAYAVLDAVRPTTPDLAGQGEPVAWAWQYQDEDGKWADTVSDFRPSDEDWRRNIRPLYAAPAPSRPADREEIARAFEEAALARDEAGYLGTPADCIRALAQENAALRDAPRDGGAWPPEGWTATPLNPPGQGYRLTRNAPSPNAGDGTQDSGQGGGR